MSEREVDLHSFNEQETNKPLKSNRGLFNKIKNDLSGIANSSKSSNELLSSLLAVNDLRTWEDVMLPSMGAYYGGAIPNGVVQVKPMGMTEDKIFATQRLVASGQYMTQILQNCVKFPGDFDSDNLLAGDQVFLLYVLRGITHGNMYEFMLQCPNCDTASLQNFDLNEIAKTIKYADPSIGDEPFKVVLPYLSDSLGKEVWVRVRFARYADILTMQNRQRIRKKVSTGVKRSTEVVLDDSALDSMSMLVVSFMDDTKDAIMIKQLLNRLHATDSSTIRTFLNDYSPAMDTTINGKCAECGSAFTTQLPITESFFRATKPGGVGE